MSFKNPFSNKDYISHLKRLGFLFILLILLLLGYVLIWYL